MDEDAEKKFVDACGRGDMRQVTKFLSSHEDVKEHIPAGLGYAIWRGKMEVVDVLLKEDFNINYRGNFGETALSLACSRGHVDIISRLLQHRDIDINKVDMSGYTPLSHSLRYIATGGSDVGFNMLMDRRDLIINHHLSPSTTMTQLQREHLTYLEVTARYGLVDSVRRLIRSGADFDFDRSNLSAALMFRCRRSPGEHTRAITGIVLEAGFRPIGGVDDVREEFEENAQVQALMMTAVSKPLTLKQGCRKSIWRILRTSRGGRNIAPGVDELKHQLPGPLIKYLKFEA